MLNIELFLFVFSKQFKVDEGCRRRMCTHLNTSIKKNEIEFVNFWMRMTCVDADGRRHVNTIRVMSHTRCGRTDGRTDRRTEKAAITCSPYGEYKKVYQT